jgi:hypothetical protein
MALILSARREPPIGAEWSEGDYDVLADGAVVGRIMKVTAAPPRSVMNSRRLIVSLSPRVTLYHIVVAMPSCASQQNWRGNGR